jgi:hypothetical protein
MMITRRTLCAIPAAATTALLLAGCGSDDQPASAAAATTVTSTAPAPSTGSSAGGGGEAEVSFDDQSGAGDSVRVARVALPEAGFVVVTADDDEGDEDDDRLVGWTVLPAGVATDVVVPLSPALTQDSDLEATLWADTDGNGSFDAAVDQRVREDDGDGDDVSEDADYDLR